MLTFALVVALWSSIVFAAESPYKSLLAAVKSSKESALKLTARTFKSFVDTGPRNYSLVIELTSLGASFDCPRCRSLHEDANLVADSYYDSVGGIGSKQFASHPVFFVYLDYSEAMAEYFRQFQISGVPFFSFVPASTESSLKIKPGSGDIDSAERLATVVSSKLSVPAFTVSRPILPFILRTLAAAAGMFVFVRYIFPLWYRNPFNPMLAFFVAMGVFFLSMAGLVFNLIRSPPFSGVKKNGDMDYIMNGSRSQYVVEGIVIASLMLVIAVAHIAINEVGGKRLTGFGQRVVFYLSFAVYILAANTLWRVFCIKYGFYPYNVSFQLPAPLQQLIPF